MINPHLLTLCSQFQVLTLRIHAQLLSDTELPEFKGSMLHGWFGHALKRASDRAFHVFYGTHEGQQPKPYAITPCLNNKTHWRKGEHFQFDITLFGESIHLLDEVIHAIQLGEKMGIGPARCGFKLTHISSRTPTDERFEITPYSLSDRFTQEADSSQYLVNLVTPCRTKHQGKVLKKGVENGEFWAKQATRRLTQLARFWVNDDEELLRLASDLPMTVNQANLSAQTYFEDWHRYSLKQNEFVPFGGIQGTFMVCDETRSLLPYYRLAEALQLGGKTTFGLGAVQLIT
ncbi:hypothetical protein N9R79_06540 [Vibrio sp.]|nr:hypothetical protein [Vibrio sp.]